MVLALYENQYLHLMLFQEYLVSQLEKKQPKNLMSISREDMAAILATYSELYQQVAGERGVPEEGNYAQLDILNIEVLYL